MPFEDFDNKIRQAAEQHHPNYDEKAWSKMNGLLDQHLPQKEDRRRRIIFFLLAFLLLGGVATWLIIDKPWKQDTLTNSQVSQNKVATSADASSQPGDVSASEKEKTNSAPATAAPDDRSATNPSTGLSTDQPTGANTDAANNNTRSGSVVSGNNATPASGTDNSKQVKNQPFKGKKTKDGENQFQADVLQGNIGRGKQQPATTSQNDKEKQTTVPGEKSTVPATVNNAKPQVSDNKNTAPGVPPANDLTAKGKVTSSPKDSANNQPKADEKKTVKKETAKKSNEFFFYLSAGPDVSSVGMGNPGKTRLLTGAGLGYTFRDRLTIRTGFYSASKVYTARPADYKPSVPVQNANYLEDISANCKVYEIPLSLSYNFGKSATHKTFASVGLSSFIMKKETYDYLYEYPGSPPLTYHYIHTVNNENKHYFSVLSLSAGYQRKINRMLSVTAEPYFKLPLAGVGYGKVKLNSFGVMFSLNVSPFATKK